jgi:hypothetical protein
MKAVLFVSCLTSAVVTLSAPGGAQSGIRPLPTYSADRAVVLTARFQSRKPSTTPAVDARYLALAETSGGMSATKRGALVGAGLGLAAGLYGGLRLAEGIVCTSPVEGGSPGCSTSRRAVGAIVLVSVASTGLGALVGAGVGSMINARRATMSGQHSELIDEGLALRLNR